MRIVPARANNEAAIKRLLESASLPTADISAKSLEHFLVCLEGAEITGVVGLDLIGGIALLRSLAVTKSFRRCGIANDLVQAAEALAQTCAVTDIYLLTTTAHQYFAARGYRKLERSAAPAAVQQTPQFNSLCPSSSVLMRKSL
jgi:amino-acid N-acetyltransferase